MITGYKKKKLGLPSEKLSGDVPRAEWRAVIVSEVIFPIVMAVLFIIAYLFVKAFPDTTGRPPPSPLIRIAVISLGLIVWNAAGPVVPHIFSAASEYWGYSDPVLPCYYPAALSPQLSTHVRIPIFSLPYHQYPVAEHNRLDGKRLRRERGR
ncbi:hypothetical protein BJ138DRAFT_1112866 [Hygrophoropsis aurantiaca]|uniref:Uncharacterized protein n=1 Tax=Hygrophoropsis aurantiaca TaxID=72124 RepID=A0ACB8AFY1_9AGAM|nr:hypothetical protein BJ138DRAFT_1112866 [Hygrophoropsis aurantiaca]